MKSLTEKYPLAPRSPKILFQLGNFIPDRNLATDETSKGHKFNRLKKYFYLFTETGRPRGSRELRPGDIDLGEFGMKQHSRFNRSPMTNHRDDPPVVSQREETVNDWKLGGTMSSWGNSRRQKVSGQGLLSGRTQGLEP